MMSTYLYVLATWMFAYWLKRFFQKRPPLPPGPPADPLIGHLRIMPLTNQENVFYEWSKKYGDVMHLRVPGQSIIVINSVEAAAELLDKRGNNYSDRPGFPTFKLMGWDNTLTFFRYGKRFQLHRKLLQQYFASAKCSAYHEIQQQAAHGLILNLSRAPQDLENHLERFSTAIITQIAYGQTIGSSEDTYMDIVKNVEYALSNCGAPGNTLVDVLPFLKYMPYWFPGTFYATKAREFRKFVRELHEYPFQVVQQQLAEGTAKPSYLSYHLDKLFREGPESDTNIHDAQGSAATIHAAGAETTWSTMSIFMLAMTLNPDCQKKAQEEIDSVVGSERLPEFGDREDLPYVNLILQETYRWNSAVPLGVPHRSVEDDIYNGMFIPKDSIIIANARGMTVDEKVYQDPFAFSPDRFLDKPHGRGEPIPTSQFGFGRRICPGRHFADASLFIGIASILSIFTIKKVVGEDGKDITPEVAFQTGLVSHPKPFQCKLEPRNEAAQKRLVSLMSITE